MSLKQEDFDSWKDHPVTIAVMDFIHQERESRKEELIQMEVGKDLEDAALQHAAYVGAAKAYKQILTIELDQLNGAEHDQTER